VTGELPLSVVLGTTQPWPELADSLDTVIPEAREIGAEVIVVDNNGRGLPEGFADENPEVVWITERGASIFRMRSVGMSIARGEVIALTEDHCLPSPGWCREHLRAHTENPDAAAVGGPVGNGATERLSAWGSFLLNHAEYLQPIEGGERATIDRANISYKRWAVPTVPSNLGVTEPFIDEQLRRSGAKFFMTTGAPVTHDQSFGLRDTLSIHFHSGRSTAGLRLLCGMGRAERIRRTITSFLLGPAMFAATTRRVARKRPRSARAIASLPIVLAIACTISAGLVAGYLTGPGGSTRHIR
jgi:hypothetical protein